MKQPKLTLELLTKIRTEFEIEYKKWSQQDSELKTAQFKRIENLYLALLLMYANQERTNPMDDSDI